MAVMRGTITKMSGRKPHVEVPDLAVGYDFGPCETTTGQLHVVGQRVLVVSVGGIPEDIVVIGVLDDDEFDRLDARYWPKADTYSRAQTDNLLAQKAAAGHSH